MDATEWPLDPSPSLNGTTTVNHTARMTTILLVLLAAGRADAGLLGTDLTLSIVAQVTPVSPIAVESFPRIATVSASSVEYPDIASLFDPNSPELPGFARSLVNVAIDVGNDFITLDFDHAGTWSYAAAFKNGYFFEFDSQALATITGATINTQFTTLGLTPSDLIFAGNTLFVNVEGLPFNPNTFARIDLTVEGGPSAVPEPGTAALCLMACATFALYWLRRRRLHANHIAGSL